MLPCRDGSCSGDASLVRFRYPGSPKVHASVAAVEPGEDVVCFWDPEPGDTLASAEVNQCYEVAAVSSPDGDDAFLDLDVRQGDRDQHGYPLARRAIRATSLAAPTAPGERWIAVGDGLLASGESGQLVGRWLRFADAVGAPRPVAYKILRTLDGGTGSDWVQIGDVRGVREAHAAGEAAWVDYGYQAGDPFSLMVPVRLTSATPAPRDSMVLFYGIADLAAVVFDDVRLVSVDAAHLQLRQYWLQDPTNEGGNALAITNTVGALVERGCHSGGEETADGDRTHGLFLPGNVQIDVSELSIRYHGDDAIGVGFAATSGTLERIHVGMRSDGAISCNCMSITGGLPHQLRVRDVVCDDATDPDVSFTTAIGAGGEVTLDGALVWGGEGSVINNGGNANLAASDLLVVGLDATVSQPLLPQDTRRFVIRDSVQTLASGTADLCLANGNASWSFRDGFVRDVVMGSRPFCWIQGGSSGTLENVAFVNARSSEPTCVGAGASRCAALVVEDPAGVVVRDVALVWQDDVGADLSAGLEVLGAVPTAGDLVLDGLLIHGFRGTGANQALSTVDAATIFDPGLPVHGPCLSANEADGNADFEAHAPPTTVRDQEPGFVDLAAYRVDTPGGSPAAEAGCGVRRGSAAPGIGSQRWMHAVSGLSPERLADDPDGDGIPVDAAATACVDGQTQD